MRKFLFFTALSMILLCGCREEENISMPTQATQEEVNTEETQSETDDTDVEIIEYDSGITGSAGDNELLESLMDDIDKQLQ